MQPHCHLTVVMDHRYLSGQADGIALTKFHRHVLVLPPKRCSRLQPLAGRPSIPAIAPVAVARSVSSKCLLHGSLCQLKACFFGRFYEIARQALPDDL